MPFSIQEKLALMLTLTGSVGKLANLIGEVSYQQITWWIRSGLPDKNGNIHFYEPPDSQFKEINRAINNAFNIYKDITHEQAKVWGLPYNSNMPVFLKRLYLKDGTIGDRVIVQNTHFLTDNMRRKIIEWLHKTRKFIGMSIQSLVNLQIYNKQADERARGPKRHLYARGKEQHAIKEEFLIRQQLGEQTRKINTPLTPFNFSTEDVIENIDFKLRERHQPATSEPGTKYASEYLLQVDGNIDPISRAAREQRRRHQLQAKAIHEKARRAKIKAFRDRGTK